MNILFCGDKAVGQGIYLSTLSLCRNTHTALRIYILTATVGKHRAIPSSFADDLQQAVRSYHKNSAVLLLDISETFGSYLPLANMGTRFTPLCMLRLFADTVAELPDRILYLDTDVLCRGDFSSLYHADLDAIEIAGVPDRYGKWFFGNVFRHDYLNSGVLLMNLKNIRKSGLLGKCRELCRDKKMFMPDQTALNKLAVKRRIDVKYNEQAKLKADTVFKHFTTYFRFWPYLHSVTIKPWDVEGLHNQLGIFEFDPILEEYKRRTNHES